MGLQINNNIAAFNSYRNLSTTDTQMGKSLEKLSSGFRINRAADDAAGLAISEGLRSQVGGLKQAVRNAQDGISVVQTAEGALTEVHSILQRMRDLAVQAGNDSNNVQSRQAIATEADALSKELTRIGNSTNFNGTKLLDGSAGTLNFQIGADGDANSQIGVNLTSVNVSAIGTALSTGGGTAFEVLTPTDAAGVYDFTSGTTTVSVDLGAAGSHTSTASVAEALNKSADFSAAFTASVNSDNELVVSSRTGGVVSGAAGAGAAGVDVAGGTAVAAGLDFSSAAGAQAAITAITGQITAVSTSRAELGAYQNRFESTINNLNVAVENLSASESRIRDTDMALEMVEFTRTQILSQAGTAMLAQANQAPQGVLQLLR